MEFVNSSSILIKWKRNVFNSIQHAIPIDTVVIDFISTNCSLLHKRMEAVVKNKTVGEAAHVLSVSSLEPSIEYCVQIRLSNPWGVSEPSNEQCFITSVDTATGEVYIC